MITPRLVELDHEPTTDDLLRLAQEAWGKRDEAAQRPPQSVMEPAAVPPPTPTPSSTPPPPTPILTDPGSLFDPVQLYTPIVGRFEWYTMPGGGRLCIHPASIAESTWAADRVFEELIGLRLVLPEDPKSDEYRRVLAKIEAERDARSAVYHVIAVCRKGESLKDEPVFNARHAEGLRANPGWMQAVLDIHERSIRLSSGKSEAQTLREVWAGFFDATGSFVETWCLQLNTDSLTSSIAILRGFGRFASAIGQRGSVSMEDLAELRRLMVLPASSEVDA